MLLWFCLCNILHFILIHFSYIPASKITKGLREGIYQIPGRRSNFTKFVGLITNSLCSMYNVYIQIHYIYICSILSLCKNIAFIYKYIYVFIKIYMPPQHIEQHICMYLCFCYKLDQSINTHSKNKYASTDFLFIHLKLRERGFVCFPFH